MLRCRVVARFSEVADSPVNGPYDDIEPYSHIAKRKRPLPAGGRREELWSNRKAESVGDEST